MTKTWDGFLSSPGGAVTQSPSPPLKAARITPISSLLPHPQALIVLDRLSVEGATYRRLSVSRIDTRAAMRCGGRSAGRDSIRLPFECGRPLTNGCSLPAVRDCGVGISDLASSCLVLGVEHDQTFRRVGNWPRCYQRAVVKKGLEVVAACVQHVIRQGWSIAWSSRKQRNRLIWTTGREP